MRRFIVAAVLGCWPISAFAVIINIPADYPTIQAGINAAANGDTLLVAPGEYTESLDIENRNILLTSAQGPQSVTIRGFAEIWGDNVDTTCVVRGFTFTTNGVDPTWAYPLIQIGRMTRYESPLIEGNILEDNNTLQDGAGISCNYAPAIIRGNIIRNNRTRSPGGGILAHTNTVVESNIISNNFSGYTICESGDAGAIEVLSSVVIRYNLIIDNEAFRYICQPNGGGIRKMYHAHQHIYNNTIVGNSARMGNGEGGYGGGIWFGFSEPPEDVIFKNNIVAFNGPGGGVYASNPDSTGLVWDYNLFFGNEGGDYIGIEPGPHDIQADPLFVHRFSGDYHLLPNSPCIDAGDPNSPLDPDGTRADIGAYYFDQTVGIDDDGQPTGPYQFQLRQNYPNPFNSQTIISYYLPESEIVSLQIFSITGHFVKALANKESQQAGEHEYTWEGTDKNGKEVSTGIYFYELYVDDHRESKPMIMIK